MGELLNHLYSYTEVYLVALVWIVVPLSTFIIYRMVKKDFLHQLFSQVDELSSQQESQESSSGLGESDHEQNSDRAEKELENLDGVEKTAQAMVENIEAEIMEFSEEAEEEAREEG